MGEEEVIGYTEALLHILGHLEHVSVMDATTSQTTHNRSRNKVTGRSPELDLPTEDRLKLLEVAAPLTQDTGGVRCDVDGGADFIQEARLFNYLQWVRWMSGCFRCVDPLGLHVLSDSVQWPRPDLLGRRRRQQL